MRNKLIILGVLVVIVGIVVVRAMTFDDWLESGSRAYFVPVIVTPSIQPVNGQVVLYKMTNVSYGPVNARLAIYNDRDGLPAKYKDFMAIRGGQTVSYVYEPRTTQFTFGETTVEAPEAVRAQFVPVPGDDPGAMRSVVANVQLVRIQAATGKGTATLESPIVVPVEHCTFEPRGFIPVHTGAKYPWNCAPQMFPYDSKWLKPGMGPVGPGRRVKN
jgi:hypothetical protein